MGIAEGIKAFLEVGMLGLCAVMMIIMFYENHKRAQQTDDEKNELIVKNHDEIKKMLDKLTSSIQSQNDLLIDRQERHYEKENERTTQLIQAIVQGVTTHVPSPDEDKKLYEINNTLDYTLKRLREDTNANRAFIVQYHNGGKGINRQAFQKMSMTNEQLKISVKPLINEFKDQYRMSLSYFINKLRDDGKCYIKNVEDMKNVDVGTYEFMKFKEMNSLYGVAIHGVENIVIAFIGLEYDGKNLPNEELINEAFAKYHSKIEKTLNK